jgi:hypothetical protein
MILWIFPAIPPIPAAAEACQTLQGSGGGPEVTAGVYLAVGVTANVDERVGRGVGETAGCGVGLGRGVLVGGGWVGTGVLVAGIFVGWGGLVVAGAVGVALG